MLLVKKYFCFELLTTGMVVGWFGLAESIGWFITSIMILVKYDQLFNPDNYPNTDMRKLSPCKFYLYNKCSGAPPFDEMF